MKKIQCLCFFLGGILFLGISNVAIAKHSAQVQNDNLAIVIGEAAEQYPIYGVGGIKVTGGHHGIFMSNGKSSPVQIDGSGITPKRFEPVNVNTNFVSLPGAAYFVSDVCACTFATAVGAAGQEIVVCNAGRNGTTITYQAAQSEILFGADQQSGNMVNSRPGKVDRFISDGKNWFRE